MTGSDGDAVGHRLVVSPKYSGDGGRLEYADGRSVICRFRVYIDDVVGVRLECEHDQEGWVFAETASFATTPNRFIAITDDLKLELKGNFVQSFDAEDAKPASGNVLVTYFCNGPGLRIGLAREHGSRPSQCVVRFRLTNLTFTGNTRTPYELPKGGFRPAWDTLALELGGRPLHLVRSGDYEQVHRALRERRIHAAVTCEATWVIAARSELDGSESQMDLLCSLLTLAAATRVSWVSYTATTHDGTLVAEVVRSAVVGPFSQGALIDTRDGGTLTAFLQSTFAALGTLDASMQIRRAIDAKTDALVGGFLETRALMASVLAEYLVKQFSKSKGYEARSFKEHADHAVRELKISIRGKEVRALVKTRDSLVHDMQFRTDDKHGEYTRLMHFVDRLFLRLLGYSGLYLNRETWENVLL